MPTGYTAPLYEDEDISFRDFTLRCARAFGALVELRDEPPDATLPESFAPSSYSERALVVARKRLAEVEVMPPESCKQAADAAYGEELRAFRDAAVKRIAVRARYEAMLDKVLAWTPPTPDHQPLKAFMVEQIESSVRFDAGGDFLYPTPVRQDAAQWRDAELARLRRDVERHAAAHAEEVERAAGRTRWLNDLRASLAEPAP